MSVSLAAQALNRVLRVAVKSHRGSPESLVRRLRLISALTPQTGPLPAPIRMRSGRVAGVPGEWLTMPAPACTILYFHGGAFVAGGPRMYRYFCAHLARQLNAEVFLPRYRLAPEHPFPAAPDDACATHAAMAQRAHAAGRPLVVMGDSAGGSLALGSVQEACRRGAATGTAVVLISPGLDAGAQAGSVLTNARRDAMLSPAIISAATTVYAGNTCRDDPRLSPLQGDFRGLPPLLITTSEDECLRDQARLAAARMRAAGGVVEELGRHGMPHVWPVFYGFLPEATADFRTISGFISRHAGLARRADDQEMRA